jgi:hypothetical protein
MSGRWFRLYDDLVNDPKVQMLAPDLFKALVNLWCLASKNGGVLPDIEHVAFSLRVTTVTAHETVTALFGLGFFDKTKDGLVPHNWSGRQYDNRVQGVGNARKSGDPTAAERMKRYRNKRNTTVTEPYQDTEQSQNRTEQIEVGAKAPNRRKRLSEDWQPRKEDLDTLGSEGFSLSEINDQLRRFRDHWKATGKPMVDWDATFRNWVRRSAEMGARGPGPPGIRRDGMRVALDKLGGNNGPRLGSLSEFLAISGDDTGSARIDYEENDKGASNSGSKADPLGISEGEQSNGC